jgi:beta-barrel assembly-enhancing protease
MTAFGRRRFVGGCSACAALALAGCVTDGVKPAPISPGYKPSAATDEGGLWQVMDRVESETKRSRFLVRDAELNDYVRDITCRLAGNHCPDVRVYITRTPAFNATMAPNGMMTVWTGLLLRTQNEAQLAAVLGHEIGHYVNRHSLQGYRNRRDTADFAAFLSIGLAGAGVGIMGSMVQLAALASIFAFNRDQEREADDVGLKLMSDAGYPAIEAAKVWEQLIAEAAASERPRERDVFFATHPAQEERAETLRTKAAALPAGDTYEERYRSRLKKFRTTLLEDELRLRQYGQSLKVFEMLGRDAQPDAELAYFTGEVYRQRNADGDAAKAREQYERALSLADVPPEAYRGLGLVHMRAGDQVRADEAFRQYLKLKPDADDRAIIRSYVQIRG